MGNSEILSSSSSSQGVILELEGEQAEDSESNDLGELIAAAGLPYACVPYACLSYPTRTLRMP